VASTNYRKKLPGLIAMWGPECFYCKEETDQPTIDHVVARSHGGTNDIENLRVCCESCNRMKSNLHPSDWHTVIIIVDAFFRTDRSTGLIR
jgi:5-methylcytosine-specific restriction endonuclease McrA